LFPSKTNLRVIASVLLGGLLLAGCSDIYFDRRETIVPSAGDAVAANKVTHMVDPWPPSSANKNIAFNGEKMQTAVERYRQGRIIPPVNATTSSVAYQAAAQQAGATQSTTATASSTAPAPSNVAGYGKP
jgi:PBP1b-binding outer membrane lipoprotein LpoB